MYYDKSQDRDPAGHDRRAPRRRQGRHDQGRLPARLVPRVRLLGRLRRQAHGRQRQVRRRHHRVSPMPTSTSRTSRRPAPSGTRSTTTWPTDFKSGKIDLIVDGPWASGGYKDALSDNLAVAPMPAGPQGPVAAADRRRRLVHQPQRQGPRSSRSTSRSRWSSAENEQVFVDVAGHIPADTTITDHRSDHPEASPRRSRPASRARRSRSSTTSGATSTTP